MTYRPPNGHAKEFEKCINKMLSTIDILKKEVVMVDNFNMKLPDFEPNKKFQTTVDILFDQGISRLTRVTKKTGTVKNVNFHQLQNQITATKF